MARNSIGVRTLSGTAGTPALEIFSGATAGAKIVRVEILVAAATASTFAIGRPSAAGVTPTSPVTLSPEDAGRPASVVSVATAWATPPAAPVFHYRRSTTPAALGGSICFEFSTGLYLGANDSFVIWNVGTNAVADVNVTTEE